MAMSALPWSPSGVEGGSDDRHPTLALLEALLLESDSEGNDDSFNGQAIEEFANEVKLEEINDESAAVRNRIGGVVCMRSTDAALLVEQSAAVARLSTSVRTRSYQRRERKCTYAARRVRLTPPC
jgi:hypothetical protein